MSQFKYRAFISYSHADEKWATWLHRQLENYRIPKKLVQRAGLASNRLKPIFRDRDELGTSPSLSNAIEEALAASETLVVICSPAAARSHWVNAEIETYIRQGRGDRIYCLLVDGEPSNAFPPALQTDNEALAADVAHDGKQNSFLKLAAGILEVPFDDLRQREQQARNRRLAIVAGFSFAGMVFAVGLASFAMISRQQAIAAQQEAEFQRGVAERAEEVAVQEAETASRISDFLVSIFQVSDPSEARGNTITARELLDIGAENIQTDLADQPEIQATLKHTIGDVYLSLGLYDPAQQLLRLALDTRRALFGEDHSDVAETLMRLAQLERDTGELADSRQSYEEALRTRLTIYAEDSLEVAEAQNDLAALLWELGDIEGSRGLYELALQTRESKLDPNHPDIATTLNGFASLAWYAEDYDRAAQDFERVLEIRRTALGDDHPLVSQTMSNLAAMFYYQEEFGQARDVYAEALEIQTVVLGPGHLDLVLYISNLAEAIVELGDLDEAQSQYDEAMAIGLAAANADNPMIAFPADGLGTVYHLKGDYDTSREYFEQALRIRLDAYGENHLIVADTLTAYAAMLRDAGNTEEAEVMEARIRSIGDAIASATEDSEGDASQ